MTGKSAISILLISAFTTSGCSTLGRASIEKVAAYGDNRPDIGTENVALYVEQQNKTIDSLSRLISGDGNWKPVEKDNKQDWTPLVQAGIQYVDVRCERYLDALFWVNRAREATSRQINYTGASVGAGLALLEASKQLIGLTPLAFTLADQTVNNIGKGLLFDLEPTTVKILVKKEQVAFKESISTITYSTRIAAIQAIQAYVNICLPTSIETQANEAIGRADFKKVDILVNKLPDKVTVDGSDSSPAAVATVTSAKASSGKSNSGTSAVVTGENPRFTDSPSKPTTSVTTTTTSSNSDGSQTISVVEKVKAAGPTPENSIPVVQQVQSGPATPQ
jgi:hypothetical protein